MSSKETTIEDFKPNPDFFQDLKTGKFVLVLGAGFSAGIKNTTNESDLSTKFNIPFEKYKYIPTSKDFNTLTNLLFQKEKDINNYRAAANLWEDCNYKIKKINLSEFFRSLFIPDKDDFSKNKLSLYRSILFPSWHGVYTLNFDTVFETIVELDKKKGFYSKWFPEHKGILPKRKDTHIAHLHGIITDENLKNLVFSDAGYDRLRREQHTLYNTLHNDANENLKLFIVGTQFYEDAIDDKFFSSLKKNLTIYHFDRKNNDFRTKPNIRNNPYYNFIKINEVDDLLNFLKMHQDQIENYNFNRYLKSIIDNESISRIDRLYVNLFGQEDLSALQINSIGIELLSEEYATSYSFNYSDKVNTILDKQDTDEEIEEDIDDCIEGIKGHAAQRQPKIDSILNIEQETQRFIIVGCPGSGKTTVIKKILFQNSKKIINNKSDIKIPVFILANEYKSDRDFKHLISEKLGVDDCESLLYDGRLQLLIDGINEIDLNQRRNSHFELTSFINNYPEIAIIITTRKTGFNNDFNIPVFELKELQESEIKEFINKRNPENQEIIWSQLVENKNILELAYNPLYLTMIVIAAKEGNLPINRGALFDSFVRALLIREKLDQNDISSIIDILSELAFYLKREGMVSIPKEKAGKIILDRIVSIHDDHSPNSLLAKVNDCNLISITSNTSFIHEAFLDYFSAVKLKTNFNILFNSDLISIEDIGIKDIAESIWYEPLIMCGDLFKEKEEENQAYDYFKLLYKSGFRKNPQTKKINELSKEDWNENLRIPCKVAYNLKNLFPNIYFTAERYLSNYMTLWLIKYKESFEIIPLSNLFEAIASLSSPKHLEEILYNVKWQEVWLYNPSDDQKEAPPATNKFVFENSRSLALSLVNNISDFDTFCKLLLDEEKLDSCFFPSIIRRLDYLEQTLLRSTSIANIKNTYLKKVPDLDLLNFISYVDPLFYIENYKKSEWGISAYMNQLIDVIHFNEAKTELVKYLLLMDESFQVSTMITLLKNKYFSIILDFLENNIFDLKFSVENISLIKSSLRLIPMKIIPQKLLQYFFLEYPIFTANYEISEVFPKEDAFAIIIQNIVNLQTLIEKLKLENKNDSFHFKYQNIEAKLDNKISVNIIKCDFEKNINKTYLHNCSAENLLLSNGDLKIIIFVKLKNQTFEYNISEIGYISELSNDNGSIFSAEYKLLKRRKRTFKFELFHCNNIDNLFTTVKEIIINKQYEGQIVSKGIISPNIQPIIWQQVGYKNLNIANIENYQIKMILRISQFSEIERIPKSSSIILPIDLKVLVKELKNIHPDDFVAKCLSLNNDIKSFIPTDEECFELARMGLVHKFHKIIPRVNYGIIISKYNYTLRIWSLTNKQIFEITTSEEEISNFAVNQIIVIEINKNIGIISPEEQRIEKIGYLSDRIIRIDYEKKEGHIRKVVKDCPEEKDYYFHFDDCDFSPRLGDTVSFLPAINVFPSSFGLPKAYRITLIKCARQCKIMKLSYDGHLMDLSGLAFDIESGMMMSFLIRRTSRLLGFKPQKGDIYSYRGTGSIINNKLFIKLLEKLNK